MKLTSLAAISALMLGACATADSKLYLASLGQTPALSGGTYTSGGGITVAADIRERDGRTLVCGVWAQSLDQSILSKGLAREVLATGAIYMNGRKIVQNLRFMREVAPVSNYSGLQAQCRIADRPWQAGDEGRPINIRIPRQEVYRDVSGNSGGTTVLFRQTGPGAGGS